MKAFSFTTLQPCLFNIYGTNIEALLYSGHCTRRKTEAMNRNMNHILAPTNSVLQPLILIIIYFSNYGMICLPEQSIVSFSFIFGAVVY